MPKKQKTSRNGPSTAARVCSVVPKSREHKVAVGEVMQCAHCGLEAKNIYQHMYQPGCKQARYYKLLGDKMREGYLFFLQRHHEYPDLFDHPGNFLMFSPEMANKIMDKVSLELLESQDQGWNVMMPLKQGSEVSKYDFWDWVHVVLEDSNQKARNNCWVKEMTTGNKEKDWELFHNKRDSKLSFTQQEQVTMELTRNQTKRKHCFMGTIPSQLMVCGPFDSIGDPKNHANMNLVNRAFLEELK